MTGVMAARGDVLDRHFDDLERKQQAFEELAALRRAACGVFSAWTHQPSSEFSLARIRTRQSATA